MEIEELLQDFRQAPPQTEADIVSITSAYLEDLDESEEPEDG
jgi:hypothetical protein